jgi:hypothetical protein
MSRNKSDNSKRAYSNYQSLYLWINFLWSLIILGVASQKVHANYPSLYLGTSFLLGMILLGIIVW